MCGKRLSCGNHVCEITCHEGKCGECPRGGERKCPCGKTGNNGSNRKRGYMGKCTCVLSEVFYFLLWVKEVIRIILSLSAIVYMYKGYTNAISNVKLT